MKGFVEMTFDVFWIDFYFEDRLFGFGVFSFKKEIELNKNMFSFHYNNGEIIIDLFWKRIYSGFPFIK